LSEFEAEEQKLRKLYDQARAQGDKKKKKEYKEKIVELNRRRKQAMRASRREVGSSQGGADSG
jgi:CRISPR/Cas system CSM-associated protein Csm2 small subunit